MRRSKTPLTGDRLFAWALGAPYHVAHGTPVDGPEDPAKADREGGRKMLADDWDVSGREDLSARMTHLGMEGHRRSNRERIMRYATMWRPEIAARRESARGAMREGGEEAGGAERDLWVLDAVQADRGGIRGSPLLGFDAARGVMLAREGWTLGWLTEEEVFDYLLDLARDARRTYRSWEEYGADYLLSRNVWRGGDASDVFDRAVARLLGDADSPWRTAPWMAPGPWAVPRPVRPIAPDTPVWTLERA